VEALAVAAEAIGAPLAVVAQLRGSTRSSVVRATVGGGPRTVIVKAHDPVFADHWRRESVALAALRGRGLPVPELLAAVEDPPLVVLADAGDGPNLADALLAGSAGSAGSAATATDRLHAWADALATLHTATTGLDLSIVDTMPELTDGACAMLVERLPALGITPGARALADLRATPGWFTTRADALTPADACPDNNVQTPQGLVLLDFEQACVRHVAWDAAYLLVPWPSCWCSWGLPARVADAALARWRAAVARAVPAVGDAAFDRDLDVAVVAWSMMSSAWFLAGAADEEHEPSGAGPVGPTRRAVIRHRMRLVTERRGISPPLADLAGEVLAATADRWGDRHLDVAPAYR
jgi:Ser/Thr protein kinase RdoA (MazF antagonist)